MTAASTTLTSRERVNRALLHQDHDRVPRHESCWNETLDRWMGEGLPATTRREALRVVHDRLESDMQELCWYWPAPFPGREEVVEEDEETQVTINASGTIERYWKHKSGTPQHIGWDCDSREKWENEYKPNFLNQPLQIDLDEVRAQNAVALKEKRWSYMAGVEAFECIRKIIGDETFMYTVFDDPEWIVDIAETEATVLLRNYQAIIDAGIQPDGIWIFGDMAFKNATFCSPASYKELVWPQHKRIADWAHANGMKVIYHTDGDVREVLELYLEAGFNCLHPLESKASMDVRDLGPKVGDRLAFFGNIDVMKLLTNDLELIEEEIASKFPAAMACKGYIYHSDHSVPPQVSWDTYQHVIKLVDRYGNYD